jgi:hypothetical protein
MQSFRVAHIINLGILQMYRVIAFLLHVACRNVVVVCELCKCIEKLNNSRNYISPVCPDRLRVNYATPPVCCLFQRATLAPVSLLVSRAWMSGRG